MQRIGILGGTFNPIHIGHLAIAQMAQEKVKLDKVIFVPAFIPPHKTVTHLADAKDRLGMVRLAITGNPGFAVSDYEIKKGGRSFSVDTVSHFRRIYAGKAKLYFIIGGDSLASLPTWKSIDQLLKWVTFIAVNRPGYKRNHKSIRHISVESELNIASSDLRKRVVQGKTIKYLVPEKVIRYIEQHKIYGKKRR
jgi:nicotinate-nucleotide adenylyltransferase